MKHEHKLGKRIFGGVFIMLGVGIYALYFWLIIMLRRLAAADHIDPEFVNALIAAGGGALVVGNWPSVLLLGFGVAWCSNASPMVRVWCYRIFTAFFLGSAGLLVAFLFTASLKNVKFSSRVTVEACIVCYFVAGLLFYWRSRKVLARAKNAQLESEKPAGDTQPVAPRKAVPQKRNASFALCNVLQTGAAGSRIWQFDARKSSFRVLHQQESPAGESLPAGLAGKNWGTLFQAKLNVAWVPPEHVFLRVAQFPQAAPAETLTMVELQLERLSPIPVTQAVWTMHVMPGSADNLQTVVVTIIERKSVEEFLGQLEGQGYLADRLEVPMLDQLQAASVKEDGAWIYPEAQGGKNTALVAWWYGGVLQSVDYITVPAGQDRAAGLKDQLIQMAWAGEMEGWLTSTPRWHLVAGEAIAGEWEAALRQGLSQPVEIIAPLPDAALAALTGRRAARAELNNSLMPDEFARRYRQQFFDRLWMRGLFALLALYVTGVIIYFIAVQVLGYQTGKVEAQIAAAGIGHTNNLQTLARFEVLKEREDLKYAALDCWNGVAKLLPDGVTVDSIRFSEGKQFLIDGTAPSQQVLAISDFCGLLSKATGSGGKPLFKSTSGAVPATSVNQGGATVRWSFALELRREEIQ